MAKTNRQTEKELEEICKFRWDGIRRNPSYIERHAKMRKVLEKSHGDHNLFIEGIKDISEANRKDFGVSGIYHPENDEGWRDFSKISAKSTPFNKETYMSELTLKIMRAGMPLDKRAFMTSEYIKKTHLEGLLEDNRYLHLRIDLFRDTSVIKKDIVKILREIKGDMKNLGLLKIIDSSPHMRNRKRYFKVFDLRNNKPPMNYKKIALTLIKEYKYRGKKLEGIVNNCKKDFKIAFEAIYNIPYKGYDGRKFKESNIKECKNCEERDRCKEPCAEIEYYLSQVIEGKRKEVLFEKGVTDVIPYEVLKKGKQRKKIVVSDDENEWRAKAFREGMNRGI